MIDHVRSNNASVTTAGSCFTRQVRIWEQGASYRCMKSHALFNPFPNYKCNSFHIIMHDNYCHLHDPCSHKTGPLHFSPLFVEALRAVVAVPGAALVFRRVG